VLNATRQTGSVLGVALFGSLIGTSSAFIGGMHISLVISAGVLLAAGALIWVGASSQARQSAKPAIARTQAPI
jgi:DHA2 family methylenomycin A resistance protein-like MFS transporter